MIRFLSGNEEAVIVLLSHPSPAALQGAKHLTSILSHTVKSFGILQGSDICVGQIYSRFNCIYHRPSTERVHKQTFRDIGVDCY